MAMTAANTVSRGTASSGLLTACFRADRERGDAGFTLIELLVVLVILGLLAAVAGPRVVGYLGGARTDTAGVQIAALELALDLYQLDVGRYPSTEEGLDALVRPPSGRARVGWNGPYLAGSELPEDPWGRPYIYREPGREGAFDLFSLGADGRPGGVGEDASVGLGAD